LKVEKNILNENILLLNVHSYFNAGDAALTEVAISQLEESFPGAKITISMNDPESYTGKHQTVISFIKWIRSDSRWQIWRSLCLFTSSIISIVIFLSINIQILFIFPEAIQKSIQAYLNADLVVCTPGGYLYSYGKGKTFLVDLFTMFLALIARKPLYLLPQSYGPLKTKQEQLMLKWLLSRARIIMAREKISYDYLLDLGLSKSHRELIPDMAFIFEGDPSDAADEWFSSNGAKSGDIYPLIGFTILDWGRQFQGFKNQQQYEDSIAELISHIVSNYSGKVILFPQCWGPTLVEDDRIPAKRIHNRLSVLHSNIIFVEDPISPPLIKSLIGRVDVMVGTRMHSNIFALSNSVPVLAIGYLHKTMGIAQTAGVGDWVVDITTINSDQLISKFEQLWDTRALVHSQLEVTMPRLAQEVRKAGSLIANDYQRFIGGS
jgi:colanic acid/amylovoran biosynthesis protein